MSLVALWRAFGTLWGAIGSHLRLFCCHWSLGGGFGVSLGVFLNALGTVKLLLVASFAPLDALWEFCWLSLGMRVACRPLGERGRGRAKRGPRPPRLESAGLTTLVHFLPPFM